MRNVLFVINIVLTRNHKKIWNFWLGQISHTIFWGVKGLGEVCLFLFTMVKFETVLYNPDLKLVLIFLFTKVVQKGTNEYLFNSHIRCYVTQWSATSLVQPPPPLGKLASQLKSPFGDSCFWLENQSFVLVLKSCFCNCKSCVHDCDDLLSFNSSRDFSSRTSV